MFDSTTYATLASGETGVSSREMSHNFSAYVKQAEGGKSFAILRHGKAVAKLVPVSNTPTPMTPKQIAARKKRIEHLLSFRFDKPYGGKFNRKDAYDE